MKSLEAPVVTFSWPKITSSATLQTVLAHAVQHSATSETVDAESAETFKANHTCHQGLQPFGSQDSSCCTIPTLASLHLEQRM